MNRDKLIEELIDLAIKEDIGNGDHSAMACIPKNAEGKAKLMAKEKAILAGLEIALKVFAKIDQELKITCFFSDGQWVDKSDIILEVHGKVHKILQAERIVLNFIQRMSGIATQTDTYCRLISDLNTKLLDTRKTTPGLRLIEKMAVKIGGGENHRFGLYDMIMLKDNHVDFAGGIKNAIIKTNEYLKTNKADLKIVIEVRNFSELEEVLQIGQINRIMLDNFSVENTKKAVEMIGKKFKTESSGGITLGNLRDYALCGVDYISIGAITHQIKSADYNLKAEF
jgi:nicotinate-nucleotide pyrophosphorylase (carboxylating)